MAKKTVYDENTGFVKLVELGDQSLAPTTASDLYGTYEYSTGGNTLPGSGHRSFPSATTELSASDLKTTRRAEGFVTWSGGLTTLALTLTGVAATDEVYAEITTDGTEGGYLVSAVPTTDTITFTLSVANTSNDAVIKYYVYA